MDLKKTLVIMIRFEELIQQGTTFPYKMLHAARELHEKNSKKRSYKERLRIYGVHHDVFLNLLRLASFDLNV